MITWIQRTFGKHHKWVILTMLAVLLVSFIFTIGAVPRGNMQQAGQVKRIFLGQDLNDQQAMQNLAYATHFTFDRLLQQNLNDQQYEDALLQRIALLHLADEWNIPAATQKQVDAYLREMPAFQDADGTFNNDVYTLFRDEIQAQPAAERDLAIATLAENARIERVRQVLGGPGYALPFFAQSQVALGGMKYNLDIATVSFSKFEAKIDVTDQVLQQVFDKNPNQFQKPAQANFSYAKFAAAPVGQPTPDQLREFATAHKDQFPDLKPDNLNEKSAEVTDAWRKAQQAGANQQASSTAMKFARELFDLKTTLGSPTLDALLKKYNVTLQELPTVIQGTPVPATSPISNDILQQALQSLNGQQYFSPPIPIDDGAAVVFLKDSSAAKAQSFAEAKEAVATFYRNQEKEKQFVTHVEEMRTAITTAMGEGKTFAAAAAAQGMTVKNYADVSDESLRTAMMDMPLDPTDKSMPPSTNPLAAMGPDLIKTLMDPKGTSLPFLLSLHSGEVSHMQTAPDTGVLFHAAKVETPALDANSPQLQRFQRAVAEQESYLSSSVLLERIMKPALDTLKQQQGGS